MRRSFKRVPLVFALAGAAVVALPGGASAGPKSKIQEAPKPWCAPEVSELSDHVCYFDGAPAGTERNTLVIYLHGALATTPGFAWLQQRAMAMHAKKHGFTVLIPTSPKVDASYVWPTGQAAQKEQEPAILAGVARARAELSRRTGKRFHETFVVGFSSGAYYASTLAVRAKLDVDGYIILAGGSSWMRPEGEPKKHAPVFVGVSAADPQTRNHSRAFGGLLAGMGWPAKVEERNAGHMVDWTFMAHGISWLRAQARAGR